MTNKEIPSKGIKENLPQEEVFSIDKNYLSKIVSLAGNFAETGYGDSRLTRGKRLCFYHTKNIELKLNKGEVEISAFNGEAMLTFPLNNIKTKEEACFDVDAKILSRVLDVLPPGEINCGFIKKREEKSPRDLNDYFQIKSGRFVANFRAKDRSWREKDLILPETEPIFTIPCGDFLNVCEKVVFAGAGEEYSLGLTEVFFGVYFKIKENQITLAATDSHRLSQKSIEGAKINKETAFIVPKKNLLGLMKVLKSEKKKSGNSLSIFIDHIKDKVFFSHPDFKMNAPLIDENYIKFEHIFSQTRTTKVNIEKEELSKALKKASSINSSPKDPVSIGIDSRDNKLLIRSISGPRGLQKGSYVEAETVDIDSNQSAEVIYLNPKYVLDFLRSVKSRMVSFEVSDPLKPVTFRPSENDIFWLHSDDKSYLHVIMPIRMSE